MNNACESYYSTDTNFLFVARNLFPPNAIRFLRKRIQEKKSHAQAAVSEREKNGETLGIASDSVRLNFEWYDVWKEADLSMLSEIIPSYDQVIFPPTIRTVKEYKGFLPWHQDLAYVKAMGKRAHQKVATCFLPLDDEPAVRPTVEYSFRPNQQPIQHVERPEYLTNQFDLREEDKPTPEQTVRFNLNIGDAILFGQLVLHRTYFPAEEFLPRNSVEFRLTQKTHRINGKDYFDLEKRTFYQYND